MLISKYLIYFSIEKKKGKYADGHSNMFDHYNFTVKRRPLEKSSIDPEMLGKIFENLLDVKDRKSKGAYHALE